jgi:hypothetical protein
MMFDLDHELWNVMRKNPFQLNYLVMILPVYPNLFHCLRSTTMKFDVVKEVHIHLNSDTDKTQVVKETIVEVEDDSFNQEVSLECSCSRLLSIIELWIGLFKVCCLVTRDSSNDV